MPIRSWHLVIPALGLLLTNPLPPVPARAPGYRLAPRPVTIVARDYTFDAPDTVAAGPTLLRFENRGTVPHELVIFGTAPGKSSAAIVAAPTGEDRRSLADPPVGVLFAPPGQPASAELVTTLQPGHWYVLFCGLRDTKEMPFHYAMGMVDSIYAR